MRLNDFDYCLPKNLIAQKPISPRDHSRLLVLDKESGEIEHKYFYNIIDYLEKGDVLVLNNSKVFPARLIGNKKETDGKIEVFLLKPRRNRTLSCSCPGRNAWQCLIGGRGAKEGLEINFNPEVSRLKCKVVKNNNDGTWEVKFNMPYKKMMEIVEKIGKVPLPPYVKRDNRQQIIDNRNYQTVYADDKKIGSVAAPTAGFHFTPALIKKLKKKGVQFEYVTLHVGLGTFAPVKEDNIKKHKMHAEQVEIKKDVLQRIIKAKKEKRRIIAVGTTSVRTLEAIASEFSIFNFQFSNNSSISNFKLKKKFHNFKGLVDIFIYPSYKFKVVDAIITNFHLQKSTLLMLVSAFAGNKNINEAYKAAIKKKYRFFSYGDAMFIR